MRLINLDTMQLEELNDKDVPEYAILSHTWGSGEVGYRDWPAQTKGSHLEGYKKIVGFRNVAYTTYRCRYGWVDTCCIDKTSSAELTEAINSMFRWYQEAAVCIAYLPDVVLQAGENDEHTRAEMICSSRWLTRGWTLQEMIAPSRVEFYDSAWKQLGKMSRHLAKRLENATGIPSSVLLKNSPPADWSVAQRMSWASQRQTTRVEDQAYCLLGLFDVSLPLIYGEGERAFTRLQEEIIRSSTDHSIFAWNFNDLLSRRSARTSSRYTPSEDYEDHASASTMPPYKFGYLSSHTTSFDTTTFNTTSSDTTSSDTTRRLLARSPAYFLGCNRVVECYLDVKGWIESYEMTNLGLGISLPVVPCSSQLGLYHAVLNCRIQDRWKGPVAINLRRISQASTAVKQANNSDLQTTTFGVVRTSDMEPSKFQCSAEHLDRLSMVEEEDLITHKKARVTILRTYSASVVSLRQTGSKKARMASVRAFKGFKTFQPGRLKLVVTGDLDTDVRRRNAVPEDQWDPTSHIWFTNGPLGVISFTWEQFQSEITFVFAAGVERDVPFHLAVFESSISAPMDCQKLLGHEYESAKTKDLRLRQLEADEARMAYWPELSSNKNQPTEIDGLQLGQLMTYDLHFATLEVRIERFDSMAKVFHKSTITVVRKDNPAPNPLLRSELLGMDPLVVASLLHVGTGGEDVVAVQHRGVVEVPATNHSGKGSTMRGKIPLTIQEEVVEAKSQALVDVRTRGGDGHSTAMPLRRQFSFEED